MPPGRSSSRPRCAAPPPAPRPAARSSAAICASARRGARRACRGPSRARRARTRSKPGAIPGSVASASNTVTLWRPRRRACSAISAARPGSSSTEITSPRSSIRAAIWPVLMPGPAQRSRTCSPGLRVEDLDHGGRAAALRGQLARRDQRRHRLADPAGDDDLLRRRRAARAPAAARASTSAAARRASDRLAGRLERLAGTRETRIATSAGWLAAASSAARRLRPELLPPHPRQPERRRVGDRGGLGGRVVARAAPPAGPRARARRGAGPR